MPIKEMKLLEPSFTVNSRKTGKLLFAMKTKTCQNGIYVIFQRNRENFTPQEEADFNEAFKMICSLYATLEVPLFSIDDIGEELAALADKAGEVKIGDVEIPILDHSTGQTHTIVINEWMEESENENQK